MFRQQAMVDQAAYDYLTAPTYQRANLKDVLLGAFARLTAVSALISAGVRVLDEFKSSHAPSRSLSRDAVYQMAMPVCQRIVNDTFDIANVIGELGFRRLAMTLSAPDARQATLAALVLLNGNALAFDVLSDVEDRLHNLHNNRWLSDRELTRIRSLIVFTLAQNNYGQYRQQIDGVARQQGAGWWEMGKQFIGEAFTYLLNP